jgi:hypothetical protein
VPTYANASANYVIASRTYDGRVTVGDDAALVMSAVWTYRNRGRLTFTQGYQAVGPYRLPSTINVEACFPGSAIDGVIHLSGYHSQKGSNDVYTPPAVARRRRSHQP